MYYVLIEWGVIEINICVLLMYNIFVEIEGNVFVYKYKVWLGYLLYFKNIFLFCVL